MTQSTASFINIGERTNVTGSAAFKKLIVEGNFAEAVNVARQQVENGCWIRKPRCAPSCASSQPSRTSPRFRS
jgi:hypothetical protein